MTLTTPGLIWLIIGIACFLLEMALPGFIIFFFGVGAWVTSNLCWFAPFSLNAQLAIFLCASLFSLFALRGLIQRTFLGTTKKHTVDDTLFEPGAKAEVIAAIEPPAEWKIQYSGSVWRATAKEAIARGNSHGHFQAC